MITIKSNINSVKRGIKAWKRFQEDQIKEQVLRSAYNIEAEAKRNVPKFTSILAATLNVKKIKSGFAAQIGSGVLSGKPLVYASAIEFGRKPGGFPPWQINSGLYKWVQLKLGITGKMGKQVAFLIARKIANEGFKGQPYLVPAHDNEKTNFSKKLAKILKKVR